MRSKLARSGTRQRNRQYLLRCIYHGEAESRADLAALTGLTKPTVSDVIGDLIAEGFLEETGYGQSTDEGGKRPRLLRFVPSARQVIGLSITAERIAGVLAMMDGQVIVEHSCWLHGVQGSAALARVTDVINGLRAQASAPLLCIGVGVEGEVDRSTRFILRSPALGWETLDLAAQLTERYHIPVYVTEATELAALAHFSFHKADSAHSVATILIENSVGIGFAVEGAAYHSGHFIDTLRIGGTPIQHHLSQAHIRERLAQIVRLNTPVPSSMEDEADLTYLTLRRALARRDPQCVDLVEALIGPLSEVVAWVLALLRPDHVILAGAIADLGESFLTAVIERTRLNMLPTLPENVTFSLDRTENLTAVGAVALALQQEIGLF